MLRYGAKLQPAGHPAPERLSRDHQAPSRSDSESIGGLDLAYNRQPFTHFGYRVIFLGTDASGTVIQPKTAFMCLL